MADLWKSTWARDGYGNPINSLRGALNIHDADVHIYPINHYIYQVLTTYTLASPIASQATSFTLTNATGLVAGNRLHLTDTANNDHDHDILMVISVVGNVVTVNRPIDFAYAVATTTVDKVAIDMNVLGSLASSQKYILYPSPGEVWHLTSMDFIMTDNTAMDDGTFGGLVALANGVVIRTYNINTNTYETFSHWRTNNSFIRDGFAVNYSAKAPSGTFGFSGSLDFHQKYGSIVRLANTTTEQIRMEFLIQDDLSGLLSFSIKFHGHIETA